MLCVLDRVTWDGAPVPGERTHALLRALVDAGSRGLSETSLVEEVWADDVPANPAKALQVVVSRARAATRGDAIERTPGGYRLALGPDEVDAWALRPEGLRLAGEGRHADAIALLERARPDDEVVAALLRSVAAVHGVPAALERYDAYRTDLADRLGVDPPPVLQELYAELLASDRPVRTGVHHYASSLVGRAGDLHEVRQLLRDHRVVSILGPGGLGKTRLANLVADRAEQPVVHVVELVGVTDPDDLVSEVGSALGVRDSVAGRRVLTPTQQRDVRSRIAQQLDVAPTLLVLDNCEHLIDAVADLVGFLVSSAPRLRVLTTTRAPLAISGERVFPLGQLAPADGATLFRERARAARPDVALPAAAVDSIVARLDGLPLAIELAAVKVRSMAVDDIDRRLENRFTLLRGGDRTAPDRHQTLVAVIDWSWNLLDEDQRRALRVLSVFHDGFDLAGAEHVVGGEALVVVPALVEQSLLAVSETPTGVRYRMLETVREFGRMQLIDAGEDADARVRHRSWAVGVADREGRRLFSPDQVAAIAAIAPEENNLAEALRLALAEPDRDAAVALTATLGGFWMIRGQHPRVLTVAGLLSSTLGDWDPPPERLDQTRAALCVAIVNAWMLQREGLDEIHARLSALGAGESPALAALVTVVLATFVTDRTDDPLDDIVEQVDPGVRGVVLQWIAHERENAGDPEGALTALEEALALVTDDLGPWSRALLHTQLAGLYVQTGAPERAAVHAASAGPVLAQLGAYDDAMQARAVLVMAALAQGEIGRAEQLVDEIAELAPRGGVGTTGLLLTTRAEVAFTKGDVVTGLELIREAADSMAELRFPGMKVAEDLTPWSIFGDAIAVTQYALHGSGSDGDDLHARLAGRALRIVDSARGFVDVPVIGLCLFALGRWAWTRQTLEQRDAVRLLVLAHRCGYPQASSVLSWPDATDDVEAAAPELLDAVEQEYGDSRGPAVVDLARGVLKRLL